MATEKPVTVFYNSACPVCDAGIENQKNKMQGCSVVWVDIHRDPSAAKELGSDLELVRERLHVKDGTGRIIVGAAALVLLWGKTPTQKWLKYLMQWPLMLWIADACYNKFAKILYRWNRWKKHW
jgi:predicted DCC family thiol-disulfide oxidoreductase YuxK